MSGGLLIKISLIPRFINSNAEDLANSRHAAPLWEIFRPRDPPGKSSAEERQSNFSRPESGATPRMPRVTGDGGEDLVFPGNSDFGEKNKFQSFSSKGNPKEKKLSFQEFLYGDLSPPFVGDGGREGFSAPRPPTSRKSQIRGVLRGRCIAGGTCRAF